MALTRCLVLLLVAASLLCGCAAGEKSETTVVQSNKASAPAPAPVEQNKIVGKWTVVEMPGLDVEVKADGTMTADMAVPNKPSVKIFTTSNYRIQGNKIYTTPTGMRVEGATDAEAKAMTDAGKSLQGQEVSGTIVWNGNDEFTITPDVPEAPKMTYKRA